MQPIHDSSSAPVSSCDMYRSPEFKGHTLKVTVQTVCKLLSIVVSKYKHQYECVVQSTAMCSPNYTLSTIIFIQEQNCGMVLHDIFGSIHRVRFTSIR